MSSLEVGIVGLPNVGKSTLFNALLKKQVAYAANFPFATVEPNIGVVPVPDERLEKLADVIANELSPSASLRVLRPPVVPAVVQFVDIAGLIAGAHKGEGLGNKFLAHIREVNVVLHVLRAFEDGEIIREGSRDPLYDFEVVKTELELADLETVQGRKKKKSKDNEEELPLFSKKPILIALNVSEEDLKKANELENKYAKELSVSVDQVVVISAKLEEELAGLSDREQLEYLRDLGVDKTGLERLIKKAFTTLGLITFLTAGEKEVRAWTIKKGISAQAAAGVIHSDFEKNFIKADVIGFEDIVKIGGWKRSRDEGKVRSEGRDYLVQDGDVIEFKIGA